MIQRIKCFFGRHNWEKRALDAEASVADTHKKLTTLMGLAANVYAHAEKKELRNQAAFALKRVRASHKEEPHGNDR